MVKRKGRINQPPIETADSGITGASAPLPERIHSSRAPSRFSSMIFRIIKGLLLNLPFKAHIKDISNPGEKPRLDIVKPSLEININEQT